MANINDVERWNEFNERYHELLSDGAEKGLVVPYFDEFFDKLRNYYCGDLSVPILILEKNMVNGHCYDRAPLVTLAFKDNDYSLLYGDVNSLRLNPKYLGRDPSSYDHCIARIEDDGIEWIIDTSIGLIFERELYEKLEEPRIRTERTKEEVNDYLKCIVTDKLIIKDDGLSSLNLDILAIDSEPIQVIYEKELKKEIALLKKKYNDVKIKKKV